MLSKSAEDRDRARAGRLAHRDGDAVRQGALQQPGHPAGAEVRDRPRADPEGAVQRLRHARQRPPDPADRSLFQQRAAAAQVRSRTRPPFHFKKAGIADPKILLQASDAAFNGAVDMATLLQASAAKAGIKIDVKKEPADGFWDNVWLKGAVRRELLGRPRRRRRRCSSVAYGAGRALERDALEQPEVREAARRRPRRNRRSQAQGLHLGDAGDAATRRAARIIPVFQRLARRA